MDWLEQETHRKYHEVASLFPLMEGDQGASALIDGHIASVFPSVQEGYFYIAHVEGQTGICEYLSKPVQREWLIEVFATMGIDVSKGQWTTEKCQPLTSPPYAETHPAKRPEPFVYFIEGAGKIKIGTAEFPEARLETLQAGSPVQLTLLATTKGGFNLETELHKRFAQHRRHGEWFESTPELRRYIDQCEKTN